MNKRITERLDALLAWVQNKDIVYGKNDFKKEIERISKAADEALWAQIITEKEHTLLMELLLYKMAKCNEIDS